jgi:hypothetical protein
MKTSVLKSVTDIKSGNGYHGVTATMENGDSGWVSSKNKDQIDFFVLCVGKEMSYEYGTTSTGGGKISRWNLSDGTAAPSGGGKSYSGGGGGYNSPDRLSIDKMRAEFEVGDKQLNINYSVALAEANKFLDMKVKAGLITKVTEKDLLSSADTIFDHMRNSINNASAGESKD